MRRAGIAAGTAFFAGAASTAFAGFFADAITAGLPGFDALAIGFFDEDDFSAAGLFFGALAT
jgi:hypothetical protein